MLFSESYDKIFWLMIAGNEKNRDNLVYFIRIIPQEVLEYVKSEIANSTYNSKRISYNKDEYIYEFQINFSDGLSIKMWRWKGYLIQEKFKILLNPFTLNQIEKINNFEKIHIGNFYCSIINNDVINTSNNSKFSFANDECYLMRTPLGYLLQVSDDFEKRIKLVNYYRNCPKELDVNDFDEGIKVERLVRCRKR